MAVVGPASDAATNATEAMSCRLVVSWAGGKVGNIARRNGAPGVAPERGFGKWVIQISVGSAVQVTGRGGARVDKCINAKSPGGDWGLVPGLTRRL